MRVFLVINPAASSVTARARAEVEERLRAAFDVTVAETVARGHARDLARDAAASGTDVVVVLAGDGTLNEAADGLAGSETPLAPLPGGSTNVFARSLGILDDPAEAAARLVRSLVDGARRRVGLGRADVADRPSRYFLFHLGVGFDAAVVRAMEQRSYLKRHFAHPAFALAAVDTWLRHYDRHARIELRAGDDVAVGPYAVVSNADPYTYVGHRRLRISPNAGLERALAVTVLTDLRASVTVRAAISGIARAEWVTTAPAITQWADVDGLTISAAAPFPWQVDGDYLGDVDRIDVGYEPASLTVVVP